MTFLNTFLAVSLALAQSIAFPGPGMPASAGGGAAITLVGSAVSGDNGGTSTSKTLTITPNSTSDIFVVWMNASSSTCTTITATDTNGTVTPVVTHAYASSLGVAGISIVTGLAAGSHSIVIAPSGGTCSANVYVQGAVQEFTGTPPGSPVDQTATAGAGVTTSPASSSPAVTTTQAKELGLGVASATGAQGYSSAGNLTFLTKLDASEYTGAFYSIYSSIKTTYTATASWSSGANTTAVIFGTVKFN